MPPFSPLRRVAGCRPSGFLPTLLGGLMLPCVALAQSAPAGPAEATVDTAASVSGLDAPLFYQLLLGELHLREGDVGQAFGLVLDAARKTGREQLFQHAMNIALRARAGDAAEEAVQAWSDAMPDSLSAAQHAMQVYLALNRPAESAQALAQLLSLLDTSQRLELLRGAATAFARLSDHAATAAAVEQALRDALRDPALASAAWTAVGRLRLDAGQTEAALAAVKQALAQGPDPLETAPLLLELLTKRVPEAETAVRQILALPDADPRGQLRLAFARALIELRRDAEAGEVLTALTATPNAPAEAWLLLGTLRWQGKQLSEADTMLQAYLRRIDGQVDDASRRGRNQALLVRSEIAEKRGDYTGAATLLDQLSDDVDPMLLAYQRAGLMLRQGQIDAALDLLREAPERQDGDAVRKLKFEAQLLRDAGRFEDAYNAYGRALATNPDEIDLLYEQAMMADRLGHHAEMERLLRQLIERKPDFHHAYNALGYALADRNERLDEARGLIQKALGFAPEDPFIQDSLGWVAFRQGLNDEARRILEAAYQRQPDPEIGAHLGEVLWSSGQQEQALVIWREALRADPENATLLATLKRLRVQP